MLLTVAGSVAASIIKNKLGGKKVQPTATVDLEAFAREVVEQTLADPRVKNEANQEKPVQSRVVVGSSTAGIAGVVSAGMILYNMYDSGTLDINLAAVQVGILWGAGYSLYGRLMPGLTPLFTRWFK